jgi:hypothetical protein
MKLLIIAIVFLITSFQAQATSVGAAMNVSGQGSDYIFVYRGNNPNEFDALVAQGLGNLAGWKATCVSSGCTTFTLTIDHATMPSADYLFLYTTSLPDSGQWYSFNSPPPPLCCGGSTAPFNPDSVNVNKAQTFYNRTTSDSQVYISQIGNGNQITVEQSGTKNNQVSYDGNGSNNTVSITQSGNSATIVNYTDLQITGNNNLATITQQSTGGSKGAFVSISDSSNSVNLQQKDSGSHYAEIKLLNGNKQVDVLQQGSGSHMASIALSGAPTALSLSQSGSAQQFYSINHNCATAGGCAAIQVQQGQ